MYFEYFIVFFCSLLSLIYGGYTINKILQCPEGSERMKEIEQDVVPVGFIEDGSQYINEIENKEQGWIPTPYNQDDVDEW